MVHLLSLLKERGDNVTFVADDFAARRAGLEPLRAMGVEVPEPPEFVSLDDHLRDNGAHYDLIVLSRPAAAMRLMPLVREYAPRARVVFDTTDLHYVRGFRGAQVTGNKNMLRRALEMKKPELDMVRIADVTLVVSPVEQEILARECPGACVQILSNINVVASEVPPFAGREGIVFVGAFPHHPNNDGMKFFVEDILPLVRRELGRVPIIVIGSEPPDWLTALNAEDFIVEGYVPDIVPMLNRSRLNIAPLRYGAGVKGKVTGSMGYGLPVVGTTVAAEGLHATDHRDMLIADDAPTFAARIAELYRDETLWNTLSVNGRSLVQEHFSMDAARRAIDEMMQTLGL